MILLPNKLNATFIEVELEDQLVVNKTNTVSGLHSDIIYKLCFILIVIMPHVAIRFLQVEVSVY